MQWAQLPAEGGSLPGTAAGCGCTARRVAAHLVRMAHAAAVDVARDGGDNEAEDGQPQVRTGMAAHSCTQKLH